MKKKQILYIVLSALVLCAIVAVIFFFNGKEEVKEPGTAQLASDALQFPDRTVTTVEYEGITANVKTISAATLADGLNDMGMLITAEYYFTDVVSYTSVKQLFGVNVAVTESSYVVSYDGVVTAGVDFSAIKVELDEEGKLCTVTMPAAALQNVDIDPESFTLINEKTGLGNPVTATDYNNSLKELEKSVTAKALEKGLLTRADKTAAELVRNFITSLMGQDSCAVIIETA